MKNGLWDQPRHWLLHSVWYILATAHFADRERRADGTLDSGVDTERGLHHRSPLLWQGSQ